MKEQEISLGVIACCGLYCSNCRKFKQAKCPGCLKYEKATWCRIRSCCMEKNIADCSQCEDFIFPKDCEKYTNFISRTIEFFTSTDKSLCIDYLRKNPHVTFAKFMDQKGWISMPKGKT